jgi:succinate dehydrogenase / fumarate reductase cytochrome b subunit
MSSRAGLLRSSVGRKQIVGLTGIYLYFFLFVHLVGNLGLLAGPEVFNAYGHFMLETLEKIIVPLEFSLLAALLVHIGLAALLARENRQARPDRYAASGSKSGRKPASRFMMLTGTWILVFTIVHVPHFRFGAYKGMPTTTLDGVLVRDLYRSVVESFASPWFTGFYVLSFALLFTHLSHGVQSSLQSLGLNHPTRNGAVRAASLAYAVLICGGFAGLAVWGFLQMGRMP